MCISSNAIFFCSSYPGFTEIVKNSEKFFVSDDSILAKMIALKFLSHSFVCGFFRSYLLQIALYFLSVVIVFRLDFDGLIYCLAFLYFNHINDPHFPVSPK